MSWSWTSSIGPARFIAINLASGLQMIIPIDRFRGIKQFKGEYSVQTVVYCADGSSYVNSYDITQDEYNRIALQLGFRIGDE